MKKTELATALLKAVRIIKDDYMSFEHTEEEANTYIHELLGIDEEDLFDLLEK